MLPLLLATAAPPWQQMARDHDTAKMEALQPVEADLERDVDVTDDFAMPAVSGAALATMASKGRSPFFKYKSDGSITGTAEPTMMIRSQYAKCPECASRQLEP